MVACSRNIFFLDDLSGELEPRYSALRQLAEEVDIGLHFLSPPFGSVSQTRAAFDRLLDECDALWIHPSTILQDPVLAEAVHQRIRKGVRALVRVNPNAWQVTIQFLKPYGMVPTRQRLVSRKVGDQSLHPSMVEISRTLETFLHPVLLQGVERIVAQQPWILDCEAGTLPVVAAYGDVQTVDSQSDRSSCQQGRPQAFIAIRPSGNHGGAVLGVAAGLFQDDDAGGMGHRLVGISANRRLAENFLRFLVDSQS